MSFPLARGQAGTGFVPLSSVGGRVRLPSGICCKVLLSHEFDQGIEATTTSASSRTGTIAAAHPGEKARIKGIKFEGDGNRVQTVVTISYDGDGRRQVEVTLAYYREQGGDWVKLGQEGSNTGDVARGDDLGLVWFNDLANGRYKVEATLWDRTNGSYAVDSMTKTFTLGN
jgi:hypothetical protein